MMIVIWKGAGILVVVIWLVSLFTGDRLARAVFGPEASNSLCNLTCQWLAAFLTLGLALLLRKQREFKLDPESGQVVEVRACHSLFFIPVIAWAVIFFGFGVYAYFITAVSSPPLFELTPSAVAKVKEEAAAKSVPIKWYLRLEAYWTEGAPSPQYDLQLVANLNRDRDHTFQTSGIQIVVLKRQVEMLRGARLDFGTKDGEARFHVDNPNFEGPQVEKYRRDLELERPSLPK